MRQRAVSIVFAHKLLVALPFLVIVLATVALDLWPQPKHWRSTAVVWVDQSRSLSQTVELGWTPAGSQVSVLNSFIHTNSFSRGVLQQTRLAPLLKDNKGSLKALKYFWESVSVTSSDVNFMTIEVTMSDPDLAWKTAQVILANYQKTLTDRGETITSVVLTDSGDELKQAQDALVDAHTQLANYIAVHPELAGIGSSGTINGFAAARDVNLALLQQQVTDTQSNYTHVRQRYLDIQQVGTSGRETQPLTFSVIDAPERPTDPVKPTLASRLQLPIIGLVLGLLLSGGAAALLVATDRSVLIADDIRATSALPLLAVLPELKSQGAVDLAEPHNSIRRQFGGGRRAS